MGGATAAPALLELTTRVAEARRRVAAGDAPPIEDVARSLSAALAPLAARAAPDLTPYLAALQDEIEALLAAAAEQRERSGRLLGELAARGRARRAYRRSG